MPGAVPGKGRACLDREVWDPANKMAVPMQLDIDTFEALRRQHPAWRLLAAESAARSTNLYPKPALEYLNDWAANDRAWLCCAR